MHIEQFRNFCLSFPGTTEEFPFDERTLVFKVIGKMFALCDVDQFESINLKCDPVQALELRETYPGTVIPGYHMNKKHWNTVFMQHNLPDDLIMEWITDSYNLVVEGLPKKDREKL
ncbi:MmcQ/YjbR family DNA-binding protein [Rhodohalobacter mucosus]|uniref:MmcQ-like protein n=1 Tax=Rhodohalobacter mucosus TaxID=2079485 RepID=A0A316TR96_9BACT|nr:MmcQ/YjbR family DNA-binding protein [Rhodohalobacter mucosus]PWN05789.1 MmcQ-like protein [Rhodohalobacter mucosus]